VDTPKHPGPEPSQESAWRGNNKRQFSGEAAARAWRSARRLLRSLGFLSAATTAIVAGGAMVGTFRVSALALVAAAIAVCAGALLIVAIPVTRFTRIQAALADKGREMATTVEEIRAMMDSDAAAFDVVFHGLLTGRFRPDQRAPLRANALDRPPELLAPPLTRPTLGVTADLPTSRAIGEPRARGRRRASEPDELDYHGPAREIPSMLAFWESLTPAEQQALRVLGRAARFEAGAVLCREGQPADNVIIIQSGRTRVYAGRSGNQRPIAERGPGDLIGERAVLMVRSRSATVLAVNTVRALVVSAEDFAVFLREYPRVNAVLELQVYQRLSEDSSQLAGTGPTAWTGQICTILLTDITAFGSRGRNDDDRRAVRRRINDLLPEAFESSNVRWLECYTEDRGDGNLIVAPPTVPVSSLVDSVVGRLAVALRQHNHQASDAVRIQLRVALHVGPVTRDLTGMTGQAIIHTARLVESSVLKRHLKDTEADLGFIASAFVYDNVIRQRGEPMDAADFKRVRFRAKESTVTAWIYLAGTPTTPPWASARSLAPVSHM
jgi:CRP-like cAMP-binding protein